MELVEKQYEYAILEETANSYVLLRRLAGNEVWYIAARNMAYGVAFDLLRKLNGKDI